MGTIATRQEMKQEAARRLANAGVDQRRIDAFLATGALPFAADGLAAEYSTPPLPFLDVASQIEERDGVLIYYGLENVVSRFDIALGALWGFLYVPADRSIWSETASLDLREHPAYVTAWNYVSEEYPQAGAADEYGQVVLERILVKNYFGGLVRIG